MDFFERYFGFTSGRGDGSLEAIILIALLVLVFGLGIGYFNKHTPQK
jgi:hypothetical protein